MKICWGIFVDLVVKEDNIKVIKLCFFMLVFGGVEKWFYN